MTVEQFKQHNKELLLRWLITDRNCTIDIARTVAPRIFSYLNLRYQGSEIPKENVIWETLYRIADTELLKLHQQMDKNFGLTEEAFDKMLEAYTQGDSRLFEQVFLKHFTYCAGYLKKHCAASEEDAYDATMETMLEFSKRLKSGKIKYGNLRFLFTKMASQIYFKWIKKEQLKDDLEGIEIEDKLTGLDQEQLNILNKAWAQLGAPCQNLLKAYYYDRTPLNKISEQIGKSPAAVRKQKQRCIEKLRSLFIQFS